jgi:hypothetical protein
MIILNSKPRLSVRQLDDKTLTRQIHRLSSILTMVDDLGSPNSPRLRWFKKHRVWCIAYLQAICNEFKFRFESYHQLDPKLQKIKCMPPRTYYTGVSFNQHIINCRKYYYQNRHLKFSWTSRTRPAYAFGKLSQRHRIIGPHISERKLITPR